MSKLFFYILVVVLVSVIYVNWRGLKTGNLNQSNKPNLSMLAVEKNSTLPFRELTIPYLRERTYQSQLSDLQEVARNNNYTSYLTSYDSDGLRVEALLTRPSGEMPTGGWPAIVFIHGYLPPTLYRTREKYVDYVNALARNGFVVFKIDLRGHGNSEGEAGGAYYSSDYVIDTLNARAALSQADFVNAAKIGLWGHSMAGNVVLRSMVSQKIPAAVIWAGAVFSYEDMRQYGLNDNSYRPPSSNTSRQEKRRQLFETHGEFDPSNSFWASVAPTNYLQDLQGALALHHAIDDNVVNVSYSRDLAAKLEQNEVVYELHEYSTGGHNITGPSFDLAMQRTIDFFTSSLK